MPWSGSWDQLPAAHAAAIFFDLMCVLGLAVLGRRLGGDRLAATLALAWLAYPYSDFVLQSNSNDSLLAALLIWSFVLFAQPLARGGLLALAATAKFVPFALAPLMLAGERGLGVVRALALGLAAAAARHGRLRRRLRAHVRPPRDRPRASPSSGSAP